MPVPKRKNKLIHFDQNTSGRDFVVGDIHGCLEELLLALKALGFDEATDRLFSVGDLIDRGPHSLECAKLIYKPWFYAVRGNHEQMMIDSVLHNNRSMLGTWLHNGGQWMHKCDKPELESIARDFDFLPLVITVGHDDNRFNIVHAELLREQDFNYPYHRIPITNEMLDQWQFDDGEETGMIWGRTIISNGKEKIEDARPDELWHDMANLSLTFVGHTPVRFPVQCQKQMYLDNGAVYHHTNSNKSEANMLIIACPTENVVHAWSMVWKKINSYKFDEIQKMG